MKPFVIGFTLTVATLTTLALFAADAPAKEVDICSQDMLISYFPAPLVEKTLKKFDIPQKDWDPILKGLSEQDKKVVDLVEAKAEKETPNPLKDPKLQANAIKIFREVLLNLFTEVLEKQGIKDEHKLKSMLDDIQEQKRMQFTQCLDRFEQEKE